MGWLSKRFTFVIIPDAKHSVQQYRVSGLFILLVPSVISLLLLFALVFFLLFSNRALLTNELKAQLTAIETRYEQQLTVKEVHISSLQTNLVQLSEQAHTMENKLVEINELEAQLKQLAGIDMKSPVTLSSLATEQGGEELQLPEGSTEKLIAQTSKQYSSLDLQLDSLIPQLEDTKKAVMNYQQLLKTTPTIWPTDSRKVTSLFGIRKDPFTRRATYHNGLDIGGKTGDPVYAAADGTVTLSQRDRILGINVLIDHGQGIQTRYLHLNKRLVESGDKVAKGQLIGELGSTGRSTGPHLHYEVSVNGKNVNPKPYIKADREEP
ncbi:peptidoglycan DD-metalloendopeptidase family protein [Paenibacillus alkaliterrae]|uniref:M23 family metallopeptidase n=1 Tax=Paenibacillus alkaliterrae TaxID=320909 RepID=UPI001F1E40D2|nr:M23 family metallopeptidase [Paenibacillus alkaliterrae]MCF2939373.1 peptidoglycan DD-metalloendopeptidase family protein [Paenibacillus alkaliterrae]